MKNILTIFFLFTTVFGYSQLSVNSAGKLVGAVNTVVITTNDTASLFAKRDTAEFANGIRKSISSESTYELFSIISSSMTLTNESETMIRTIGTLTITLPVANTCYIDGKSKVFRITKGDGSTTLTIINSAGTPLFVTANLNSTFVLVTNGTTWYNMNSGQ